jgi:hypothetical protein
MIAAGVKLDKLATQPNDLLCVNIGKRVRTHRRPEETEEGLMRAQSVDGAQWIPARLLEIMPGQVVKTTLGSKHTSDMIANALRLPAENAGLIENEGLEIIGVKSNNGGKHPLVNLPIEQVIVRSMQYTDFPQGVAGLFCQRKIDRGSSRDSCSTEVELPQHEQNTRAWTLEFAKCQIQKRRNHRKASHARDA